MPRQSRLDAPGTLHHVIVSGMERRKIFLGDDDKKDFLERCGMVFQEAGTSCYAFALMSNHVHLLLRTGPTPLAVVMARLLTGYAVHFNRVHKRHGSLFQNRYKSIVCQEDPYLREMVRYIHLNLVKGRVVRDLDELVSSPYSGHAALMGTMVCPWQDSGFVLSAFGPSEKEARAAYLSYVKEGLTRKVNLEGGGLVRSRGGWTEAIKSPDRPKGDLRVLGDSQFVQAILAQAGESLDHQYELKAMGIDLPFVERRVCDVLGVSRDDLYSRGRRKHSARAKALFCFFAVRDLGMSQTGVAELLRITQPGVAAAVARGEKLAREEGYRLLSGAEKD